MFHFFRASQENKSISILANRKIAKMVQHNPQQI